MKTDKIQTLTAAIGKLSAKELAEVRKALARRERKVEGELVETEMIDAVKACPHCGGSKLRSAGSKGGRRRFKCIACSKTFNAFKGTPLEGLHRPELFLTNARSMVEGATVREAAERLGVATSTAFRWRHRFLSNIEKRQPDALLGVVEADETFFLESFKGQRKIPNGRKPKKRGTPAEKRGLSKEQIPVLVARDRAVKATLSAVLPSRKGEDISAVLSSRLARDAVLITDGATAYLRVGKDRGVEVRAVPANPKKKAPGPNHINNVNAYDRRLKKWMDRFHGVATKYLHNYVGWHRWLDAHKSDAKARKFLMDAVKA